MGAYRFASLCEVKKKAVYKKATRKYFKDEAAMKNVGENIRRYRQEKEISIETLANECEVDYTQVQRMEAGKVNFSISYLYKIAKALDIEPEKLLAEQPSK